jgi:hypothetical protein
MPPCLGFPRGRATHQICLMKEGAIRTAPTTVRLNSCLEASGVQATPRNVRIDVEDVYHVVATIGPSAVPCIATKERTVRTNSAPLEQADAYCNSVTKDLLVVTPFRAIRDGFRAIDFTHQTWGVRVALLRGCTR